MHQDTRDGREQHPVMACAECGNQTAWNPFRYCSWAR
ncbi:hypothetical protein J2S46_000505 [Kitasatospora herbaricolor]|nr:hypothetical protein [Kitasatospora herbaricolor]